MSIHHRHISYVALAAVLALFITCHVSACASASQPCQCPPGFHPVQIGTEAHWVPERVRAKPYYSGSAYSRISSIGEVERIPGHYEDVPAYRCESDDSSKPPCPCGSGF